MQILKKRCKIKEIKVDGTCFGIFPLLHDWLKRLTWYGDRIFKGVVWREFGIDAFDF